MKNKYRFYFCLFFTFFSFSLYAQDSFSSFPCSVNGKDLNVKVSMKGSGIYSLWIEALSYDQDCPVGGLVIREKNLYRFYDAMKLAKYTYLNDIERLAQNKKVNENQSLNIFNTVDVFFQTNSWNLDYNVQLSFTISYLIKDGKKCPILKVSTGPIRSETNPEIQSNGYGLIFSSVEEINRFLDAISPDKVNSYVNLKSVNGVLLKENVFQNSGDGFLSRIDCGLKFSGDVVYSGEAYGMDLGNSVTIASPSIASNGAYDLGGYVRLNFKRIFAQPELLYTCGNSNYMMTINSIGTIKTVTLSLLHLPLKMGYSLISNTKTNLRLFVGPDFIYNCASSVRCTYFQSTVKTLSPSDLKYDITPLNLGVIGGFGIDYWRFTLDVQCNYGRNMFRTIFKSQQMDRDFFIQDFQVGLGVKIN